MGITSRRKGARIEQEIVNRHEAIGVKAERYPASGATHFRGSSHDIDIYAFGAEDAPLVTEVKGRKTGEGFVTLERWLDEYDALFLRRDRQDPLVVIPWRIWKRFLALSNPHVEVADEGAEASREAQPPQSAA